MTDQDRWLLPEGIEEALPAEAARLETYRRRLLDLYDTWGYALVMPPFIEYLESLLTGTGHDLDLKTFKLTDQLTGRLMGVRADMTPQVARIDAHCLKHEVPTRLCYLGTVLHTRPEGLAVTRSPLQVGAELYGHAGLDSDIEIIRLMLQTLEACSVDAASVDLGHVGLFRGLARQAGLSPEQESECFDMLQRKALPELGEYVEAAGLDETVARMLLDIAELNGGVEVLDEARKRLSLANADVLDALEYLALVVEAVRKFHPDVVLHIDLAELRGYHYHTGVVFAAYVGGEGQEVARGGRYDEIGKVFGRARPATGFSTDLKTLVRVGNDPWTEPGGGIFAPADDDPLLAEAVSELRARGQRVTRALSGQSGGAREMGCERELVRRDNQWTLVDVK